MELLEKTLKNIKAEDKEAVKLAWKRLDKLTKPIGSLGSLEEIAAKMAGITGKVHNSINKKNIVIMCGDNGVVEEGISACPQNITATVTDNFTKDITGVGVLSRFSNAELTIVDIGVNAEFNNPKIINRKIAYGTKNIACGPAMTMEQAVKAIEVGIDIVNQLAKQGVNMLGTGEMGVGNTTTSAAVLSALSNISPDLVVGKGAGLTEEAFEHKKDIVKKAIKINKAYGNNVIEIISKVGGFDIAGLCGCFLGAAANRLPIVIDGFISSVAALCAYKLNPLVKEYMFPSHLSAEPGATYIMKEIGLEPFLNLNMRLGEGSGCPMAFQIIEAALCVMNDMGTFEEAAINDECYVDIR